MTHAAAAALALLLSGLQAPALPPLASTGPEGDADTLALTLDQVIRHTLEGNTTVLLGHQGLADRAGALRAAGGPFDASLGLAVFRNRAVTPLAPTAGANVPASGSDTDGYRLDLEKQTRWGLRLTPSVSVSRVHPHGSVDASTGSAALDLRLGLPLLRDRWGRTARAGELAAKELYAGGRAGLRQRSATGVLEAVSAYWGYVAAHRRLDVHRRAERRADALLADMERLVEADERPRSDLGQALGNRSSKRVARILAERSVVEAQRRMVVAMGRDRADVIRLPPPATAFPAVTPFRCGTAASSRLVETALARRGDLRAAAAEERAAEVLWEASRDRLNPRLDLTASVGYEGLVADEGAGALVTPLASNVRGLNVAVGLQYRLPVSRSGAAGEALRNRAAVDRQGILRRDLRRRVRAGVSAACSAVELTSVAAVESDEAVRLARSTVEAEKTKLQLGMATLFDVLLAEDGLVGALLGRVDTRRNHAEAIAVLRFESGTLTADEPGLAAAGIHERVTTVP